jgi:hypothetical protein
LFPLVFFPFLVVRAVAMRALDFYGDEHTFIVFLCALVVITPLSYFLDHLQYSICRYFPRIDRANSR